ncbi:MAG: putative toxin-antitoxin system toxin component, PIN family [Pirellulaceae bacterium]
MRVVLDTNILARAASGPPGLASQILMDVTRPANTLVFSPFLLSELSRVLRYARLRPIHGLTDDGIDRYILDLQLVAEMVAPPPRPTPVVSRDLDDDGVIATAVCGRADVICTLDRHLLQPDVTEYCLAHSIAVLTDQQLRDRLR